MNIGSILARSCLKLRLILFKKKSIIKDSRFNYNVAIGAYIRPKS